MDPDAGDLVLLPFALHVTGEELESGTLVKPSWVRTDKLFTIDQQLVREAVALSAATTLSQGRRRSDRP